MIPIFLTLFLSCAVKKETPNTTVEIPLSGSFCFDGFIKNFLAMPCKEKRTGEGPMGSEIFSCENNNKSTIYYVIIPSSTENINIKMITCQDDFISIIKYINESI